MKKITLLFLVTACSFSCNKPTNTPGNNNTGTPCTSPVAPAALNNIQVFPKDYPLNADISSMSVDPSSNNVIAAIGNSPLHPDFGSSSSIGIPFTLVCGSQTKVPIIYRANNNGGNYWDQSDSGPFPIPDNAAIEGNGAGDSHVLVCDIENKLLYELYNATKNIGTGWSASSGAIFDLKTDYYRTDGWTSADAAGLPMLPCLTRYDEMASGKITHALRFTLDNAHVYNGYVNPARHKVSGGGALGNSLPMGARIRLKASFDISGHSKNMQVILTAMKTYGLILADIGSNMFFSGASDARWDDNDLNTLKNVKATDFELVTLGTIK